MDWVLRSTQIHSNFSNLGFLDANGYHVNPNCNATLEAILHNLVTEDKYLRTFRRSISFGQNITKDLIPLLIHTNDDKTTELLIRILVDLTTPIECLVAVDVISQNDVGRHAIFEINSLLTSTKVAFTNHRATNMVMEFLKKNVDYKQNSNLSAEQCANISNTLLLLRNILHIPEDNSNQCPSYNGTSHGLQNQILWNIFSQSIDKILIKLMTIPDATIWAVPMVQLVALLYKDQHIDTLHKLLNMWLEASLSESSEDNECNTSSPDGGSEDSSALLTSEPTSDSSETSDTDARRNCHELNQGNNEFTSINKRNENLSDATQQADEKKVVNHGMENRADITLKAIEKDKAISCRSNAFLMQGEQAQPLAKEQKTMVSGNSDRYGSQIENQESITTSSSEDELTAQKPVHRKPYNRKQRIKNEVWSGANLQERKKKKIYKRRKANILNVQGLLNNTPTDDDISNVLKEFTIDFLLKGYNPLVQTLHSQILTNLELKIDISHFFWLVTYFFKFAIQIELDLERICSVLSFDMLSYFTAEGVNLCEQFELAIKLDGNDLKPYMRRLHLAVTAIREFIQAIEVYNKSIHISKDDQEALIKLQITMCDTEELRCLMVLLIRHYNPRYHTKQYLQDLVVTNHKLLMLLDNVLKLPDYRGTTSMPEHLKQFATPEVMLQYGRLLEDYAVNGEYINDCTFTMMHHVAGELDSLITLFQPTILRTFTSIWKSEFEICDDWSDLIQYFMNTFVKKPQPLRSMAKILLGEVTFEDENLARQEEAFINLPERTETVTGKSPKEAWTEVEISFLNWNYLQCNSMPDAIGEIIKMFKGYGISKSRDSVINKLYQQKVINKNDFDKYVKGETEPNFKPDQPNKDFRTYEIGKLCEQITQDGESKFLDWLQKVLLDTCYVKIYLEKKKNLILDNAGSKLLNFELFKKKPIDYPGMSPVAYHALIFNQSVPLVPWNCSQAAICKDIKFLQLLHKLGFHMPVDSSKVFIRIPHFWAPDFLFDVASKIGPIDKSKLKFSISDIPKRGKTVKANMKLETNSLTNYNDIDVSMIETSDYPYRIQKQNHLTTRLNDTPMRGTSINSDSGEVNKHNWLEVVRKSQEYNISLATASGSNEEDEGKDSDIVMKWLLEEQDLPAARMFTNLSETTTPINSVAAPLLPPTVVDTPVFNMNLAESEYYNESFSDTASIASELTHMCVSDEEEKPEVLRWPAAAAMQLDDTDTSRRSNKRRRLRVKFSPSF